MVNTHFPRQFTPSVVGMVLFALTVIACPSRTQAQLPIRPGADQLQTVIPVRKTPESYKLGGGDRIQVEILEVPELSRGYEVLSDGSVTIVTVSLVAARPLNVGVIGEVTRPGNFIISLTPGPGVAPSVQYPTVTQAIRLAEGVTGIADLRNIRVRRPQPDGPDQVLSVNLWKFLQEGDISQDIILQDRDTIVIPTVANFNQAESRQFAIANFSPPPEKPRSISIVGQVTRPGAYVVIGGNTTNEASPPSSAPFS